MTVSNRLCRLMPSDRQSVATSSRCSASPIASTRARRSSGVSSPVTASMRSFGKALRSACRHMLGGGDEAAEDDRVGALGDQRLEQLRQQLRASDRAPWPGSRPAPRARRADSSSSSPEVGSTSTASPSSESSSNTCSSSRSGSAARRLRSALAAAAGDEPTQRISASVPQKASRRRRCPGLRPRRRRGSSRARRRGMRGAHR